MPMTTSATAADSPSAPVPRPMPPRPRPGRRPLGRRVGHLLLPLLPFAILLALWAVGWQVFRPDAATLPSPWDTGETFVRLVQEGTLLDHARASLVRLGLGLVVGIGTGVVVGYAVGRSEIAHDLIMPVANFFVGVSGMAWIPLAIMWFGVGDNMVAFVIWNSTFFVVMFNTILGVRQVPTRLYEATRTLGGGPARGFFQVTVPGSFHFVLAGMRIGVGFGWRALIGAELIGTSSGLGFMIFEGGLNLRADVVVAGNLVIAAFALVTDFVILAPIEKRTAARWGLIGTADGRGAVA